MMHAPVGDPDDFSKAAAGNGLVAAFERMLSLCNTVIVVLAAPVFSLLFFFLTPPLFLMEGVPVLFILFL